jgi:hypothetical protein
LRPELSTNNEDTILKLRWSLQVFKSILAPQILDFKFGELYGCKMDLKSKFQKKINWLTLGSCGLKNFYIDMIFFSHDSSIMSSGSYAKTRPLKNYSFRSYRALIGYSFRGPRAILMAPTVQSDSVIFGLIICKTNGNV